MWFSIATEPLPVTYEDYPFHFEWYMKFETAVSGIIPRCVLPNYLTSFRLAACAFLTWGLSFLSNTAFIVIAAAAAVTDFLDGIAARAHHQKTRLGVLLDPVADKLLVATVVYMLLKRGGIDTPLVLFIVLGETHLVLIPMASLIYRAAKNGNYIPLMRSEDRVKPVIFGRVKLHFYLLGFAFVMTGLALQCELLTDLGNKLALMGAGFSWLALGAYFRRWVKDPH